MIQSENVDLSVDDLDESKLRVGFFIAAIFNWIVALVLVADVQGFFKVLSISQLPKEPLFVDLFSGCVAVFGVGYYWISRDIAGNLNILKLGIYGKSTVVAVAIGYCSTGMVDWPFMVPVFGDFIFTLYFLYVYKRYSR